MTLDELKQLEEQLWAAADSLRANTGLKSNEYSTPILGLIFLKFADNKYSAFEAAIMQEFNESQGTRRAKTVAEIAIKQHYACHFRTFLELFAQDCRRAILAAIIDENDFVAALECVQGRIEAVKQRL